MTTIDEMDEMDFINWDAAAAPTGFDLLNDSEGAAKPIDDVPEVSDQSNMSLLFEDAEGDDWSYWAMEHFESAQVSQNLNVSPGQPSRNQPPTSAGMYWEFPESPCDQCALGGFQCKRIREGQYKGYCTSCVALGCGCSFGQSLNNLSVNEGASFPANPWPIMGDRPATSILHEDELASDLMQAPWRSSLTTPATDKQPPSNPPSMPKVGARLSRESVKILKNWLVTHSRHPYPTDEEKEGLQKITGLSKLQITNWLANARRRGKIQPTRATSPHIGRGYAQAMDIPQRGSSPSLETMNPLQRWANSPPENEPASVTAIARAVSASHSFSATSGSGRNSPYVSNFSDDGSNRSLCNLSSASSLETSHSSGGSFASAYSNQSRGSLGSLPSFAHTRGRRRRRRAPPKRAQEESNQPLKTFQCTFCTETFRTKHDWQRHEKSLHLSLERWICSPNGSRSVNPVNGLPSCVFCGEVNPDDDHIEKHNFSGCTERTPEERTFYRKDHLRQHLKLVHNVKFLSWSMERWRVSSPEIRSRCGFCGTVLDSWTIRVDHIAEHFKTGNTMADWKGDWGFDAPVLEMVENSIPPYLIHDERRSPQPYIAGQDGPSPLANAYEILKTELQYWTADTTLERGYPPTDVEMQFEACRIIFATQIVSKDVRLASASWLFDLILSSDEMKRNAMFQPIRGQSNHLMSPFRLNDKSDIFEECDFEKQMQDFVGARKLLGLTAMDYELQDEACRIIGRFEEKSSNPSEDLANWFIRLINSSTMWLQNFRQRAQLPRSEEIGNASQRSKDPKTIDSTVHNYSRLDAELCEYLQTRRSMGAEPSDAELQRQGRIIIYEVDDEWNQTAADDEEWLLKFRQRYPPLISVPTTSSMGSSASMNAPRPNFEVQLMDTTSHDKLPKSNRTKTSIRIGPSFLNDGNGFARLARGLSRFVMQTMSVNNPNRHVPTDAELQNQARWMIYDDDDPWNQTPADNAEWLQRLKVETGILPPESGPGIAGGGLSWDTIQGGSGLAPSYVNPNSTATIELPKENPSVKLREGAKSFEPAANTMNHCVRNPIQQNQAPAKVFCSRELEGGLTEFVKRELSKKGQFPSDSQLQQRARDIMSMQRTACDDPLLLGKFKAFMRGTVDAQRTTETLERPELPFTAVSSNDAGNEMFSFDALMPMVPTTTSALTQALTSVPTTTSAEDLTLTFTVAPGTMETNQFSTGMDLDMNLTEQEVNDILQGISPVFSGSGSGRVQ